MCHKLRGFESLFGASGGNAARVLSSMAAALSGTNIAAHREQREAFRIVKERAERIAASARGPPPMLIIPLTGTLSKKNPPIVTIGIIAVCCFVFFVVQSSDTRRYEQAQEFYFDSGLDKIELSAYFTYLSRTRQDKSAEALAKKQN